ncbi:hypothetical protein L198_03559 [Cryptococcus wingfieldii CBS 7118]|uniref:Uncharacterized protein n=1 Tax=Cryptococcus wingfieldii CBS 7118 TaxID=1295528 RepID=A0A1E3JCA8_9TREE|nr:hypothetical protein L198_03559 [Cryptococcus wingfieldii CBS 7118]ODN98315.1 hypothetical protein L198_03559 [Cryptococcus wingfieldii CBS 7118]
MDTDSQLGHVLTAIQTSRPVLIKVARFLLSECRQRSAPGTAQSEVQSTTLSSLFKPSLAGKRKRSVTHFEGIPISAISAPSLPPSLSSSPTFTPTSSPADFRLHSKSNDNIQGRRVVSLKRAMGFYQSMSGLSVGEQGGSWCSDDSRGDDDYKFAYGCSNQEQKPQIVDDSEGDDDDDIETDSDDEDDVVLVFDRPTW